MGAIKESVIKQEWQEHELKMDSDSIIVKVLINRVLFKLTLINISYKYYSIMNKDLITELWLPRVKIPLKLVIGFIKENTKEP